MKMDTVLKGGTIITENDSFVGQIGILNEKIAVVAGMDVNLKSNEVIELTGKYILPGAIDPHVHFQDPGFTEREDFTHGTMAAAAGGITTVISHPLDFPPTTTLEAVRVKEEAYKGKAYVDYAIHIGATSQNVDKISELWEQTGATAIKMFMCDSVKEFPFVEDEQLIKVLSKVAKEDAVAIIHCENNALNKIMEEQFKREGRTDPAAFNCSHSKESEIEAIQRAIYFAEITGAKIVILHVSTAEGLRMIHSAKERGVKVWAESAPHMFHFIDKDMDKKGALLKFTPVMHDAKNQEEMWKLAGKGYVDSIGSDHSPYTLEEKNRGKENIWKAPNGIPGIETSLMVFLDGVNKGKLTLNQVAKMTSTNTAKIYGLYPNKGSIQVGTDADFTIIDLEKEKMVQVEQLKSKCKWSPYIGDCFKGEVAMTVVRGKVVYKDGEIIGQMGYGKYQHRNK